MSFIFDRSEAPKPVAVQRLRNEKDTEKLKNKTAQIWGDLFYKIHSPHIVYQPLKWVQRNVWRIFRDNSPIFTIRI